MNLKSIKTGFYILQFSEPIGFSGIVKCGKKNHVTQEKLRLCTMKCFKMQEEVGE